ncbi:MAG TPA: PadR family transcriptional regulator [Candidatus Thermoplasmatota archaeon]|nr:PadR family transcriptional regulator [Candidatus Thermoplasmatota archaeon]
MSNVLHFETHNGKQNGILILYLLHSLQKQPKSGYEIISEIKQKTEGTWIPSKGTIYPLLKQLEKDGLIKVKTTEKRSKNIFKITPKGKKMVLNTKKQGESMMKKFMKYRNLIIDMIEEDSEILSTMMQIQNSTFLAYKEKKKEVIKILRRCSSELQKEVN